MIDGMGRLDGLSGNGGNDRLTIHSGQERVAGGGGGSGSETLQFGEELCFLGLAGRAGDRLTNIEAIDLRSGSGNVNTVRIMLDQLLALSDETDTLTVGGDTGDQLQIETGWQIGPSDTAGYDQYTFTQDGHTGILLVGQALTGSMGNWMWV